MQNMKNKNVAERIVIVSYLLESIANKKVLEPLGLSMSGYKILHILNGNGPVAISKIIECLGSTKSNVSQRLNYLERSELVKRSSPSDKDRRQVNVILTEEGKKKFLEVRCLLEKESVKLEELFSEKEINDVLEFLNKIFEILTSNLK